MSDTIAIKINGKDCNVKPKSTILEAAQQNGFYIPHMCYDKRLSAYGGCRLCLVELEGVPKLLAACSTPVTPDMSILTETDKLAKARKTVLELLLIHHPLDCPVCDKAGECELQDLTFKYGSSKSRFKGKRKHDPEMLAAPLVERNTNRCILCGKCTRICNHHQGVGAISLIGRGFDTVVSPAFEETLDCEFCGQCIDVCPVGALGSKPYRFSSRVWMMTDHDDICPYCGCGCTVTLGIEKDRIMRSVGKEDKGISKGNLCGRGRFGFDYMYSDSRLTVPLIRQDGELQPSTWTEAYKHIRHELKKITKRHGPETIGAIGSPRCTVEDNYAFQGLMREAVGTDNIDSSARLGYAKVQQAIKKAFGLDRLPVGFDDPLGADTILVVESDITSTHPTYGINMLTAVRKGNAELIVLDPKMTKLSRHSTDWLRMRPGTTVAMLNGMMSVIITEELAAESATSIAGYADLKQKLEDYTPEKVQEMTGVDAKRLIAAARTYAAGTKRQLCLTVGDYENTKGVDTVLAAANLVMLLGDSPESLQIPSDMANTLGLFEAGVRPDAGPGHSPVKNVGMDLHDMFYSDEPKLKAMFIMGENPMVSFPETEKVKATLSGLEFLVVQDILNTETAQMADVILPAASWSEREGTYIGMTGIPQSTHKNVPSPGKTKPDWQIAAELAEMMDVDLGMMGEGNATKKAMSVVTSGPDTNEPQLAFNPVEQKMGESADDDYPFALTVGVLMQHSGSLSSLSNSLGSVVSDAYVMLNNQDASELDVKDDSHVKVASKRGEVYMKARVTDEVPKGMLFVTAHFHHANVNTLTYASRNGEAPITAASLTPA